MKTGFLACLILLLPCLQAWSSEGSLRVGWEHEITGSRSSSYVGLEAVRAIKDRYAVGFAFYEALGEYKPSDMRGGVFVERYGGLSLKVNAPINEQCQLSIGAVLGVGYGREYEMDYDLYSENNGFFRVLKPEITFDYLIASRNSLSVKASYLIHGASKPDKAVTMGFGYVYQF